MVQGEASSATSPAAVRSGSRAAAYGMTSPRQGVTTTGPSPEAARTAASCSGVRKPERDDDAGVVTDRAERDLRRTASFGR